MTVKSNKSALVKAVDYLSVHDYSVKRLRDKLHRCGYEKAEIDAALGKLLQKGYLNDAALCKSMSRGYIVAGRYSVLEIKYKLRSKGFSSDVIADCLDGDLAEYEKKAACRALKIHFTKKQDTGKYMQYLYRKGFCSASIAYAAENFTAST